MLLALALGLLAAAAPAGDTVPGSIRGSVQTEPSGLPTVGARVEVRTAQGGRFVVFADSTGAYRVDSVPAGRHTLFVDRIGLRPLVMDVLVPPGGVVELDIALTENPVRVPPLVVVIPPPRRDTTGTPPPDPRPPGVRIESSPAEADLPVGTGGNGSGDTPPGENQPDGDLLYVRGPATDLRLVLVNDIPVYLPFHLAGLFDRFEPGVLDSAGLYLGGAPARYDGGLASVLDLLTRAGSADTLRASGVLDLVSGRGIAEGPLPGRAHFLLSARAAHTLMLERLAGRSFPVRYHDVLGRLDLPLDSDSLTLTLFTNHEGVRVDSAGGGESFAGWGSRAVSLRYRGQLLRTPGRFTLAWSRFGSALPLHRGDPARLDGRAHRVRVAMDLERDYRGVRFGYGWSYGRTELGSRVRGPQGEGGARREDRVAGDVGGGYVEARWRKGRVSLRGGARGDMFSSGPLVVFSPRLEASWEPAGRMLLTLAGGRYHQFVLDAADLSGELVAAGATHLSLGLRRELADSLGLGVEGHFKHYNGLPAATRVGTDHVGANVWVNGATGGLSGWMSYSVTWAWAAPDSGGAGARFAGRHYLSAGLSGEHRKLGRLALRVAYGAGLPLTALEPAVAVEPLSGPLLDSSADAPGGPGDTAPAAGREEEYLRVDAEVSRAFAVRVGARRTELTPYLKVINALDRRDGVFYEYDEERDETSVVAALPLLPVFGVQWRL